MVLTACVCWSVFMHWRCPWTPAAPIQSHLAVWHSRNGLLPAKVLGPPDGWHSAPGRRWAWQTPEVGDLEACFLAQEGVLPPLPPMVLTLLPCTGWSAPPPSVSVLPVTVHTPHAHSLMWPPPPLPCSFQISTFTLSLPHERTKLPSLFFNPQPLTPAGHLGAE